RLRRLGVLSAYESVSSLFPSRSELARRRARIAALDPPRMAADLRAALEQAGFDVEAFKPFLERLERPPPPLNPDDAGPELAFLFHAHVKDVKDGPGGTPHRLVATYLYPARGRLQEAIAALQQEAAAAPGDGMLTGEALLENVLYEVV